MGWWSELPWWLRFGAFKLNYHEMVILDAEDLAEMGVKKAYEALLPKLRQYIPLPADVEEFCDSDAPRYTVRCKEREYVVYSPDLQEGEGMAWGRATYVLFSIVNALLAGSSYHFYAINGGNDLGGMFLTPKKVERAKRSLRRKMDWPYMPNLEDPWYGQNH